MLEGFDKTDSSYVALMDMAALVHGAGGRALLVGGCVRDALLGVPNKDYDVEIYGMSAANIEKLLAGRYEISSVGMSFGVLKVHKYDIDLALPRTENKIGAGHKGFQVDFDSTLSYSDAASRRDFTINAIMYDPLTGEIVDPWHGQEDLRAKVLRHVSPHFSEDSLRVLRAMQFVARLGFSVAPGTMELCRGLKQDELAMERLAGEWEKLLLKGRKPSLGLEFLNECGWLRYYPELKALIGCGQNPAWHPEGDVWVHTMRALDAAVQYRSGVLDDDLCLMLAVLCHDMGKPVTSMVQEDGRITSRGHDDEGVKPAVTFMSRIWNRPELIEQAALLVKYHMQPFFMVRGNASDSAYRRLSLKVKRMDLLQKVSMCDALGVGDGKSSLAWADGFAHKMEELAIQDSSPKPIVLGRHLMGMGVKPGKEMGAYLAKCFDAQLDGVFCDLDGGLDFARKLL